MRKWLRILRGMLGMGVTFSAGVGVIASAVAGVAWLLPGGANLGDLAQLVVSSAAWAFPIGVAFSGVTAIAARGRSFEKLSLPAFAALGAGAGLMLFGVLALSAWDSWTLRLALENAAIFVVFGAGSATASLMLARKARPALDAPDGAPRLGDGDSETPA